MYYLFKQIEKVTFKTNFFSDNILLYSMYVKQFCITFAFNQMYANLFLITVKLPAV